MSNLDFLGSNGGQIAIAFGTGCAAGYAFCVRTIHQMLKTHSEHAHDECIKRIEKLEEEKQKLADRLHLIEERWMMGTERQKLQLSDSSIHLLDSQNKLGRGGPQE